MLTREQRKERDAPLKPCPFVTCSSTDVHVVDHPAGWGVVCCECSAQGPLILDAGHGAEAMQAAIDGWNSRATEAP